MMARFRTGMVLPVLIVGILIISSMLPVSGFARSSVKTHPTETQTSFNSVSSEIDDLNHHLSQAAPNSHNSELIAKGTTQKQPVRFIYDFNHLPDNPSRVLVQLQIQLPESVTELRLSLPENVDATPVDTTGFTRTSGEFDWQWTQETRAPTLRFSVDTTNSVPSMDTGSWAFITKNAYFIYDVRYWYDGENPGVMEQIDLSTENGFAGADIAIVGSQTEVTQRKLTDQQLQIVVPDESFSDGAATRDVIVETLLDASSRLKVGARDERINLFVTSGPQTGGRAWTDSRSWWYEDADDIWVHEDEEVQSPENAWVHEYVHTRQMFKLDRSMRWIREAIATYYAALFTWKQGRISEESLKSHLGTSEGKQARLVDPSTWRSVNRTADYTKGRRVIAALDAKIQQETDSEASFQDVFRRLNSYEGEITYDDFKRIVSDVTGSNLDEWLDRYIRQSDVPEVSQLTGVLDSGISGPSHEDTPQNMTPTSHRSTESHVDESIDGVKVTSPSCGTIKLINPTNSWVSFVVFEAVEEGDTLPAVGPGETMVLGQEDFHTDLPETISVKALEGKPEDTGKLVEVNEKITAEVAVDSC